MSKAKIQLLSLFALLFILGACQSEGKIEGEVFIVTQGRENIEMGLVEVRAIQAEQLNNKLDEILESSKKEFKDISKRTNEKLRQVRVNSEDKKKLERSLLSGENKVNKLQVEKEGFLDDGKTAPRFKDRRVKDLEGGPNIGDRVITYNENTKVKQKPTGLAGKQNEVKEVIERGTKGVVVEVDTLWENYKVDLGNNIGWIWRANLVPADEWKTVQERRKRLNEIKKSVGKLRRSIADKTERVNELAAQVRDYYDTLKRYRSNGFYFSSLPEASDTDETGADGQFELTVDAGVPHYLVAEASRSVGDEEEQYYWMVETTVSAGETKEVNLSNDNLGGAANMKYALDDRTLATVNEIWQAAIRLAKEGEEMDWEKLIYRTAFPEDTTDSPLPDDLNVPEEKLLSNR